MAESMRRRECRGERHGGENSGRRSMGEDMKGGLHGCERSKGKEVPLRIRKDKELSEKK